MQNWGFSFPPWAAPWGNPQAGTTPCDNCHLHPGQSFSCISVKSSNIRHTKSDVVKKWAAFSERTRIRALALAGGWMNEKSMPCDVNSRISVWKWRRGNGTFIWSPCWSRHHDVKVAIVGLHPCINTESSATAITCSNIQIGILIMHVQTG